MTDATKTDTTATEVDAFATYVSGLDRGAKAALRRSLAFPPGAWPGAFPYVERWLPVGANRWQRTVYYLVAGLQCLSRSEVTHDDLGKAVKSLQDRTGSSSVEKRFIALLDADEEQLPQRLRQLVTLLSSQGIAPDWARLRRHLLAWNHPDRYVQQNWARSFYAAPITNDENWAA